MLAAALSLVMQAGSANPFVQTPDIHGDMAAFNVEGDIWVSNLKTGESRRLTTDPGNERGPQFSPDGTMLAFEAEYDGTRQVYVMPVDGGIAKRVTNVEAFRAFTGWTPDGKNLVFRTVGVPTNYFYWTVPASGGIPKKLPLEFASHVWFGPNSQDFTFTRFNRWSAAWFRYAGGMQNQIWTFRGGKFTQITKLPGTSEFPVWMGDRIYFANEQNAQFTLMSVPAAGGSPRTELAAQPFEIREMSTDGSKLIFEMGNQVKVFDPVSKTAQAITPNLHSDLVHARPYSVAARDFVVVSSITPTGQRVLSESRGQIVSLPVDDGEARVWKSKPGVRLRHPVMSPDARHVAYFSDESTEKQLWIANADGTGEKQITHDTKGQLVDFVWSPDSKNIVLFDSDMKLRWIDPATGKDTLIAKTAAGWTMPALDISPDSRYVVFLDTIGEVLFNQVKIWDSRTGKSQAVSDGRSSDIGCAFSTDGNYLVMLTNRNINAESDPLLNQLNTSNPVVPMILPLRKDLPDPLALKDPLEPVKEDEKKDEAKKDDKPKEIDFDGLWDRRIELPIPPSTYTNIAMIGARVFIAGGSVIKIFDTRNKVFADFTQAGGFDISADNKNLFIQGGATLRIHPIDGSPMKQGNWGNLRLAVDPASEWPEIFWDAWRHLRDYFYVANMHGVDWKAVGNKYAAFLPSVRSREDLDELIRWMQSELGSSHEYRSPGDVRDIKPRLAYAGLGIDVEEDASGYYKISKIYRGDGFRTSERSPLLGPGRDVKEGMYLLEVGGVPAKVGTNPFESIIGRAGQTVSVVINSKPSMDGAQRILVKPVGSESRMRQQEWVEQNRRYVDKISNGRIGYIHMWAMGTGDMNDFIVQYQAQRNKEALVIDGRFNNGGWTQEFMNRILGVRLAGYFNQRNSPYPWTRQGDYFAGPMACLINEFDISCGEEFPHRFRDLKLGPLVGRRTMGGEVGSDPGWLLMDGGRVSVPNYGFWSPTKGWEIEGKGISPDIDVESDPNAFLLGRDPQIDKAVEVLMKQLPAKPRVFPAEPPARDRTKEPGK